jgi:hypothetical protein
MTPEQRAAQIVKWFQEDGHAYYDELLDPIAAAIRAAELAGWQACRAAAEKVAMKEYHHGPRAIADAIRTLEPSVPEEDAAGYDARDEGGYVAE